MNLKHILTSSRISLFGRTLDFQSKGSGSNPGYDFLLILLLSKFYYLKLKFFYVRIKLLILIKSWCNDYTNYLFIITN
jgi:hypothetical protein